MLAVSPGQRFNRRVGGCIREKEGGGSLIINVNKINNFRNFYSNFSPLGNMF